MVSISKKQITIGLMVIAVLFVILPDYLLQNEWAMHSLTLVLHVHVNVAMLAHQVYAVATD